VVERDREARSEGMTTIQVPNESMQEQENGVQKEGLERKRKREANWDRKS
jgi:hypothetical protein